MWVKCKIFIESLVLYEIIAIFAGVKLKQVTILIVSAVNLLMTACSTMTAAEKAAKAQAVEKALASRHYVVDVRVMYPRRGSAVHVSSNYSLEVRGDTLVSYLPYIGRAYSIPYGGGKGLNFTAPISGYEYSKDKAGRMRIRIVTNNDEDVIEYVLELFDNGQASIDFQSRERESISYSGELITKEE